MNTERTGEQQRYLLTDQERKVAREMVGGETWFGLLSPDGKLLGGEILDQIFSNPEIDTVVFIGEPGVNKTTLAMQLATCLNQISGGDMQIKCIWFDNVLRGTVELLNKDYRYWDPSDWDIFSDSFYTYLKNSEKGEPFFQDATFFFRNNVTNKAEIKGRRITIVEAVGLREEGGRNRAVTALEKISDDPDMKKRTLIIGVIPDPRTQRQAGAIRSYVESTPPIEVIPGLAANWSLIVKGLEHMTPMRQGIQFKLLVGMMAPPDRIEAISTEITRAAEAWAAASPENIQKVDNFSLPSQIESLSDEDRKTMKLKGAYLVSRIVEQYNAPEPQGRAVISRFKGPGEEKTLHVVLPPRTDNKVA